MVYPASPSQSWSWCRTVEEPGSLQPPDPPRSDGHLKSDTDSNWQKSFNPCRV